MLRLCDGCVFVCCVELLLAVFGLCVVCGGCLVAVPVLVHCCDCVLLHMPCVLVVMWLLCRTDSGCSWGVWFICSGSCVDLFLYVLGCVSCVVAVVCLRLYLSNA